MPTFDFTRGSSPEAILQSGLDAALRPIEIQNRAAMQLAETENNRAHQEAQLAGARAYQETLDKNREKRTDDREIKRDVRRRKEREDDELDALRVRAAIAGVKTAGLTKEQLAAAVGQAEPEKQMAESLARQEATIELNQRKARENRLKSSGLVGPDISDQEIAVQEERNRSELESVKSSEADRRSAEWVADPNNANLIANYYHLLNQRTELLKTANPDIYTIPPVDRVKIGEAVLANPEVATINLTPEQANLIRSGNWEALASNPKARLKPMDAQAILSAAVTARNQLEQAGMITAQARQSLAARALAPKLEAIQRDIGQMERTFPQLFRAVTHGDIDPAGPPEAGAVQPGADPASAAGLPPLPDSSAAPPAGTLPMAPAGTAAPVTHGSAVPQPSPAPQMDGAYMPLAPSDELMRQAKAHAREATLNFQSPEFSRAPGGARDNILVKSAEMNPVKRALYNTMAGAFNVQPEQIGGSRFYTHPSSVVRDDPARIDALLGGLSEADRNRLIIKALADAQGY